MSTPSIFVFRYFKSAIYGSLDLVMSLFTVCTKRSVCPFACA
jgi:hypothetical protein